MMNILKAQWAIMLLLAITSCHSNKKNAETPQATQIADTHTSENSLDWQGTYQGVLPCADCEGIKTTITLNNDLTFKIKEVYLGKKEGVFESKGTFKWLSNGQKITLSDNNRNYFVGENTLTRLDNSGEKIEGDLASLYILNKLITKEIAFTGTKWKLVTLFGKEVVDTKAFIMFTEENNKVYGNNSCNSFNGAFEIKNGSQLKLSKMATTMMACPDMATEKQFMEVLNIADNFSLNGNTMTLNKARMAPLAVFKAEE
ncbi:copper resistance protein NlpE N-terminal domain-containing protein [Mariniflexile maritimum]|uniref:copper resistance protein NlpE N-terminal domain-containing protein n=1 Tax=Mariniflexile maritimum TaxID=2682493 RepID=UPI001E59D79C|nr:copper resistance protein NlpE N-terminal domain-containing protein [Mariniflexile maritimum]